MIHRLTRGFRQWRRSIRSPNIHDSNVDELRRLATAGIPITFLSSFPRSGNTWMRMVLSDILTVEAGHNVADNLAIHAERIIPDIYYHPISDRVDFVADASPLVREIGIFVKTHEPLEKTVAWFANQDQANHARHLCLFRRPQDALVSFFHYNLKHSAMQNRTRHGIDHFCLDHVKLWIDCLSGYVDAAGEHPSRVHLVNYEQMLKQASNLVANCFDWLSYSVSQSVIDQAIANRDFARLQKKEKARSRDPSTLFFRNGTSGAGSKELRQETWQAIEDQTASYFRLALQRTSVNPQKDKVA